MEKKKVTKRIQNGRPSGSSRLFNLMRLSARRLKRRSVENTDTKAEETPAPSDGTDTYTGKRRDRKPKRQDWTDGIKEQAPQDNVQQGQEETGENQPDTEQGQEQA